MCLQRLTRWEKEAAVNHPRPSSLPFPSLLQGTLSLCMHARVYLLIPLTHLQILTNAVLCCQFIFGVETMAYLN